MAMLEDGGPAASPPSFNVDDGNDGRLSAKVNFADRHPSISQTCLSGTIWVGSVVILILTIWAATAENYAFATVPKECRQNGNYNEAHRKEACEAKKDYCPDGWLKRTGTANVCLSKSLAKSEITCEANAVKKCLDDPHCGNRNAQVFTAMMEELQFTPDEADLHPYTAELVARVRKQQISDAEEDGATNTVVPIRRLRDVTRAQLEAAAGRRLNADGLKQKSMLQMLASPYLLPVMFPCLMLFATGWFAVLRFAPACAMWTTVGFFVCGMLYMCGLAFSHDDTQSGGIVLLVITIAYCVYMAYFYKMINAGCACLGTGLKALAESPASLLVIVASCALMMMYTAVLVALLVFTSKIMTVNDTSSTVTYGPDYNRQTETHYGCDFSPLSASFTPVFTIAFMLTSNFFAMCSNFSIAFALACWYFHGGEGPEEGVPARPILTGMKMALATRNGAGVCTQAAIIITLVEYIEKKVKQKSPCSCCDPMWLLAMALYCTLKTCLQSLCAFAIVAVAVEGGPFFQTTKHAKDTIGDERAARFLIVDSSLNWLLKLQAHTLATAFGTLTFFLIDKVEHLGIFDVIGGSITHDDIGARGGQFILVGVVWVFFVLFRRPLMTATVVILVEIYLAHFWRHYYVGKWINCISAACLVGSIGSLVFHMFAQAAEGALAAMLYCWSLDEALGNKPRTQSHKDRHEMVSSLMDTVISLQPLAPSPQNQAMMQPQQQNYGQQPQMQPQMQQNLMSVQCPPGAQPGQIVTVPLADGRTAQVAIPAGVGEGQIFQFQV